MVSGWLELLDPSVTMLFTSRVQAVVEGLHFATGHALCASLIPSQRGRKSFRAHEILAVFSQERESKRMTHDQHPTFPHHICEDACPAHSSGKGAMSSPLDPLYAFDSVFQGWPVHGKSSPLIIKIILYNQF